MKKTLYSTFFNGIENNYPLENMILSAINHVDEILIATVCDNRDSSIDYLQSLASKYSIKVFVSDLSFKDFCVDGKLKQKALCESKKSKADLLVQLDSDEEMRRESSSFSWNDFYKKNDFALSLNSVKIPNINLYRDRNHYFSIIYKWTFHPTTANRGVVERARLDDSRYPDWPTKFDKDICDGCALLDYTGSLYPSTNVPSSLLKVEDLENQPYIIHTGYLNLKHKAERNKNFWKKTWDSYGYKIAEDVKTQENEFDKSYYLHNLNL